MTLEKITKLASSFRTRNEFKIAHPREYGKVIRNKGWRDVAFSHMEWVAGRNKDRANITDKEAIETALKFSTIKDLRKSDYGVYCYIKANPHLRVSTYSHMKVLRKKSKFKIKDVDNKGLYFLYKNNEIVYVGKSITNIMNRLNTHLLDKEFDRVEVFSMRNKSDIAIMEMYFIAKHKPKYNIDSLSSDVPTIDIANFKDMCVNKYTFSN